MLEGYDCGGRSSCGLYGLCDCGGRAWGGGCWGLSSEPEKKLAMASKIEAITPISKMRMKMKSTRVDQEAIKHFKVGKEPMDMQANTTK